MYFSSESEDVCRPSAVSSLSSSVSSIPLPSDQPYVTVLRSTSYPTNKAFRLGESGEVEKVDYQKAYEFNAEAIRVSNIEELARLLTEISADPHKIVIRGLHKNKTAKGVRRKVEHFPEHPEGTPWVMLDFDDVGVPKGMDPLSQRALEWIVSKLPNEFHPASYFYQFSSSAGILEADGQLKKKGFNGHLFFWLDRRIPGSDLTGYLIRHCIETGFYEVGEDAGGGVKVTFGVDPATIRTPNQPHYVAVPEVGPGVSCVLRAEDRQGLIKKRLHEVALPSLPEDIFAIAKALKDRVTTDYKRAHGYTLKSLHTRVAGGTAVTRYYAKEEASVSGGKVFKEGRLSPDGKHCQLFFNGENSPGSWFISKSRPQVATRYGNFDKLCLKELSQGAYEFVRDQLGWFQEIGHRNLSLTSDGYLLPIHSFATAKASLVLAPTGSGKTRAAIDWIKRIVDLEIGLVVYAAPTISLLKQMQEDLIGETFPRAYYEDSDIRRGELPPGGLILTTNKSLPLVLEKIYAACRSHYLILDEIHTGFDELSSSNKGRQTMESALLKAQQTLMLTGTMTEVQRRGLVDVVGHALSSLSLADYCCYEFAPVKQNPLDVRPLANFGSDLVSLLEKLSGKQKAGEELPRVVVLLPRSKLGAYRSLLRNYGLERQAHVVSRQENTQEEIDEARTSRLPILIASPLFALGLNFDIEPDILLCSFEHLPADTSHIIQTVNRANRGSKQCEVRVYGNVSPSPVSFDIPNKDKLKAEVGELLREEASLEGVLEEHFHIDRDTYLLLRQAEKNSCVALSYLVQQDLIQNYRVVQPEEVLEPCKEKGKEYKAHKKEAKVAYQGAISASAGKLVGLPLDLYFWKHDKLMQEQREARYLTKPRVPQEVENDKIGLAMQLCELDQPQQARVVSFMKVRRLFGESSPWLSAQYDRDSYTDWAKVQAEKTEHIALLLRKLGELKSGKVTASDLAGSLTRNQSFSAGFLALANNDTELLTMSKRLKEHVEAKKKVREKGSDNQRREVQVQGLELLKDLLEPLGIGFGKSKGPDGRQRTDYSQPLIPSGWDFESMAMNLERQALRLRALPVEQKVPMEDDSKTVGEKLVRKEVCINCVFFHQNSCALGNQVDWQGGDWGESLTSECKGFKRFKAKKAA